MSEYNIQELCEFLRDAPELELQKFDVPFLNTQEDLDAIIKTMAERHHDYGTCVYAMSICAEASFNYIAHVLGTTGFQSSCADLAFIGHTRGIDGPFALVKAQDMLYPQYDIIGKVREYIDGWRPWASEEAKKNLADAKDYVHPDVLARWKELAGVA